MDKGGEKSKMIKIQAIGIGIIALSLLACSIGLVIVEDQDEEYTVIDAGNRSFKVSIPIPNAEGDAAHLIPSGSIIHYSAGKAIIKKENDYEWAIATEKGRIYGVKKEGEKLIVPISGHPSELQEEDLVLIKKLLTLPIGAIHKNFMWLKPGESGETYYTFYTRNGGPGEVSYKIYRVAAVGEKEEIPMPEGLEVSIEPSKFMAQPHRNYTSKITVRTSPELVPYIPPTTSPEGFLEHSPIIALFILHLQANFEGENKTIGDDWLRVVVSQSSLGGVEGCFPCGYRSKSITLKPGETRETYYTVYTGKSEPGVVSYEIYRVGGVDGEEKIPMPEGLRVSIEPSKFFAQPHQSYISKIRIETSPELSPGEYSLRIHVGSDYGGSGGGLTVNVV